jgi:hypothetical protein
MAVYEMWQAWRMHGIPPAGGGWGDQPLDLLARIHAIDMVYDTRRFMLSKGSDWTKLTATQRELAKWMDK